MAISSHVRRNRTDRARSLSHIIAVEMRTLLIKIIINVSLCLLFRQLSCCWDMRQFNALISWRETRDYIVINTPCLFNYLPIFIRLSLLICKQKLNVNTYSFCTQFFRKQFFCKSGTGSILLQNSWAAICHFRDILQTQCRGIDTAETGGV